ncbi:KIF15 [Symbiodinium natans]|uniref:KIF15 protein n=1 Tax=Symbiodinium natans TaxID=878477 RepID=A0A812MZU9_9DINO|nr:KIF15 [Symbiodinium natans]
MPASVGKDAGRLRNLSSGRLDMMSAAVAGRAPCSFEMQAKTADSEVHLAVVRLYWCIALQAIAGRFYWCSTISATGHHAYLAEETRGGFHLVGAVSSHSKNAWLSVLEDEKIVNFSDEGLFSEIGNAFLQVALTFCAQVVLRGQIRKIRGSVGICAAILAPLASAAFQFGSCTLRVLPNLCTPRDAALSQFHMPGNLCPFLLRRPAGAIVIPMLKKNQPGESFMFPLQAMSYAEALRWLRHFLLMPWASSPPEVPPLNFTVHSLKATMLSMSLQVNVDEVDRKRQGHHRISSSALYSRDDVHGMLRCQTCIRDSIRTGFRFLVPQHRGGQQPLTPAYVPPEAFSKDYEFEPFQWFSFQLDGSDDLLQSSNGSWEVAENQLVTPDPDTEALDKDLVYHSDPGSSDESEEEPSAPPAEEHNLGEPDEFLLGSCTAVLHVLCPADALSGTLVNGTYMRAKCGATLPADRLMIHTSVSRIVLALSTNISPALSLLDMADSELESALAKEGLAAEVIKVATEGGWTASAFKHVVETQAEVEGAIPEIFPATIEVTDANMGISGIQRILAVHDVALAMVGSAHLARLKAYSCKFVQLVSQRFDPASGLRAPTILEAQQADCRIWQSIHSLVSEKAWSLNDALHEFTEIRGELSTLLQDKGGKPKGAPGRHITFVKEIQVQAVSLDMISSLQLGHPRYCRPLGLHAFFPPGETWNALCVSRNILTSPHKDTANLPGSSNLTVGIGSCSDGGLWIEDQAGTVPQFIPKLGVTLMGKIVRTHHEPFKFPVHLWHCTQPWLGDRWVLTAFTLPGAMSWDEACVQGWLHCGSTALIVLPACAFGENWAKTWLFASSFQALSVMGQTCQHGRNAHESVQRRESDGSFRSRKTAKYPECLAAEFALHIRPLLAGAQIEHTLATASALVPVKALDVGPWVIHDGAGMATDANTWEVREHQPLHLHALEALACFCGDPDVSLCKSLLQGVPTGYNNDIPVSNCFWPNQKENLEDVSLSIHMQNWRSASVDPSVTQALLQEEIDQGFCFKFDGDIEAAKAKWPGALAIGKLSVVRAPNRSERLVLDNSVCGTNASCSVPEVQHMPSVRDVMHCFPLRGTRSRQAAISLDVKSAHKRCVVKESEQGLLGFAFADSLYFYRVAPFGAVFAQHWPLAWGEAALSGDLCRGGRCGVLTFSGLHPSRPDRTKTFYPSDARAIVKRKMTQMRTMRMPCLQILQTPHILLFHLVLLCQIAVETRCARFCAYQCRVEAWTLCRFAYLFVSAHCMFARTVRVMLLTVSTFLRWDMCLAELDSLLGFRPRVCEVPNAGDSPFSNPLQLAGGNCATSFTFLFVLRRGANRITPFDQTMLWEHSEAVAGNRFDYKCPFTSCVAANLHCVILASGGSLVISFFLENATADLSFSVDPVQPPGSTLAVPLGQVRVTHCAVGVAMSRLRFSGSFMFESALTQLEPALQQFVNQELPSVACSQISPLLEQQATAALASVLTQVEPLLTGHHQLPPAPHPVGNVVDWSSFPPARLLHGLIKSKQGVVASLMKRISAQKVPLDELHINRSIIVDALGTTFRSYLQEVTVEGLDSFVEGSLDVRGHGQILTSTASFSDLRFSVKIQAQLESVDRRSLKQALPLLENFEMLVELGNISAETDVLAMVSQEALAALEVDQFQKLECLVTCARGAALGPEAPVALRRFEIQNMTIPMARMIGGDSLGDDLAAAMTAMLRATLHGYAASIPKIIQSSTIILHDALNDMVQQTLEQTPPCQNTEVYFGPEGLVNMFLLLASLLLALIGVVSGIGAEMRSDEDDERWGRFCNKSSLAACPAVPRGVSVGYPFFLVATMFLFLYSDLGLGTVINIVFQAGSERMKVGPAFSFSVLTLSRDSLRGGAWLLAVFIVGLSGVWPFVKLGLLLHVWLAPTTSLRPSRRSRMLLFLDEYGKYSLVDSWLAILALCAFDIKWFGEDVSVQVTPVPMLPFFTFVIASVLSLVLGHIATELNRRSLEDALPSRQSSRRSIESGPRNSLWRGLSRGHAALLLSLTLLTGIALVGAAPLTSLQYKVSGVIADLLLNPEEKDLKYSLVSLGTFLTTGFQESGGLHVVQLIFFTFTLAIPLLLVFAVLALLLMPMKRTQHIFLWKLCHVLDAWAAFDVFVLAVAVANFEFWIFTNFLIYHDNLAAACGWVRENLELECLAMECHVLPGFSLLAAAGVGSYAVPKMVLSSCEGLLDQAEPISDSDDEESELL